MGKRGWAESVYGAVMEAAALLGARVTLVGPVWMGGMTQYEKCVDVQPGAKGLVGSRLHLYEDEPPKPVGGLAMAATGRK